MAEDRVDIFDRIRNKRVLRPTQQHPKDFVGAFVRDMWIEKIRLP